MASVPIVCSAARHRATVELGGEIVKESVGVVAVEHRSPAVAAITGYIRGGCRTCAVCPLRRPNHCEIDLHAFGLGIPHLPGQYAPIELVLLRLQEPPNGQQTNPLGASFSSLV